MLSYYTWKYRILDFVVGEVLEKRGEGRED
jgi:hypothetical protein